MTTRGLAISNRRTLIWRLHCEALWLSPDDIAKLAGCTRQHVAKIVDQERRKALAIACGAK